MDLQDQVKYLIKKTGLRPDKLRGQNFCIDKNVIYDMVKTAQVNKDDQTLEVGPGFGFLTTELITHAKEVISVELDKKLIKPLKQIEKTCNNFKVIEGNILDFQVESEKFSNYKVVANLPYSITSVFLKKFLNREKTPQSMTLLIQKEVAERVCAKQGSMSKLSVSVQLYSDPKIIKIVKPESFWPKPAVDSAILQIDNIHGYEYDDQVSEKIFWQVVKSGFSAKRKQLQNNLKNSLHLTPNEIDKIFKVSGINKQNRAQELTILDWVKLAKSFKQVNIDV